MIPINTDAPVYHWPWVTVTVIVVNVLLHVFVPLSPIADNPLLLEFGDGLHPVEWIACAFLHFDWLHLVGNMVFLWVFGIVVEGKLGWWRYSLVYFGIALVHGFLEQLMMLGYDGPLVGSGGASGVVFGLMAMAFVWAPRNDVTVVTWLIRPWVFDVSIQWFCGFYVVLQVVIWWSSDQPMTSEFVHILGAVLGGILSVVMLKRRWVDCENWDLFSVMANRHGRMAAEEIHHHRDVTTVAAVKAKPRFADEQPGSGGSSAEGRWLQRLQRALEEEDAEAALELHERWQRQALGRRLPDEDFVRLVEVLGRAGEWDDVQWLLEDYCRASPKTAWVVLRLLEFLVENRRLGRLAREFLRLVKRSSRDAPPETRERVSELEQRLRRGRTRRRRRKTIEIESDEEWPFE